MVGNLVLFYLGETSYCLMETVVRGVIVALAHLTHQDSPLPGSP